MVKVSAEFDDVRKLRLVTLEMGTWGREPLGCSRNLTTKMVEGGINHQKRLYNIVRYCLKEPLAIQ